MRLNGLAAGIGGFTASVNTRCCYRTAEPKKLQMQINMLKKIWWSLLALTLLVGGVIALIDEGLRTPAAPLGIVSFELCAYSNACADVVASWDSKARQLAALSLGIDYLFLVLYPAVIFVSLLLVAPLLPPRLERFTRGSGWAAWGMGFADAFENYFLTQMLLSESVLGLGWPAAVFASIKFAILAFTLTWFAVAGVMCAVKKARTPKIG